MSSAQASNLFRLPSFRTQSPPLRGSALFRSIHRILPVILYHFFFSRLVVAMAEVIVDYEMIDTSLQWFDGLVEWNRNLPASKIGNLFPQRRWRLRLVDLQRLASKHPRFPVRFRIHQFWLSVKISGLTKQIIYALVWQFLKGWTNDILVLVWFLNYRTYSGWATESSWSMVGIAVLSGDSTISLYEIESYFHESSVATFVPVIAIKQLLLW